jgi:hypothetical protein
MSTPLSSPGVFNVLDGWLDLGGGGLGPFVGMVPNDISMAAQNTQVLNQIILLAQASCTNNAPYAAVILFPGHYTVPDPDGDGQDTGFGVWQGAEYYLQAPGDVGESPAILINCDNPIRFLGTGNAELTMSIPDAAVPSGDMFQIAAGGNNIGGFTFENLTFTYPFIDETDDTGLGKIPQWCAIHTTTPGGAQNCRILRCGFYDCPIGVWFEQALQCSMFECSTYYHLNAGIAVKLGAGEDSSMDKAGNAKEIYITDCLFNGGNVAHGGMTELPGSTAFWLQGTDHVRVTNAQVDQFQNGIYIAPKHHGNCVRSQFTACALYVGTDDPPDSKMGSAVLIQPQLSGAGVSQILFEGCYFQMGNMSTPTEDVPGILIDAATNQGPVDTIRFVSCHSVQFPGPGLKIVGFGSVDSAFPANVEVLGGLYSANYYSGESHTSVDSFGIQIGISTGVKVVGASCVGQYDDIILTGISPSPQQSVGIVIDDGASEVVVDACDLRVNSASGIVVNAASGVTISACDASSNGGYGVLVNGGATDVNIEGCDVRFNGLNGIKVDGSSADVENIFVRDCNAKWFAGYSTAISITGIAAHGDTIQVTNCPGYNDQKAVINSNTPPTGAAHKSASLNGYYGPSLILLRLGPPAVGVVSTVTVNGTSYNMPTNSLFTVFLNSANDTIQFANLPSSGNTFTWTGE